MWDSALQGLSDITAGSWWSGLFSGWSVLLLLLALIVFGFLIWQLRQAAEKKAAGVDAEATPNRKLSPRQFVKASVTALVDLMTPREWCYHQPWYLYVGIGGSGKQSLIYPLQGEIKPHLTAKESKLSATHAAWRFFNSGVLIDVDEQLFATDSSDSAGIAKNWKALVERVQRYRPERPIDGVVVNIGADQLLRSNEGFQHALQALRAALWQLQHMSLYAYTVYVVVNDCNEIPGFTEFVGAIPEAQRQQICGWSNPDVVGQTFDATLFRRDLSGIHAELKAKTLQIAASDVDIDDVDALLLFPHRFSQIQEQLLQTLDTLFKQTDPQGTLLLRGVYFTGSAEQLKSTCFVRDLFVKKIFPEANIAYPTQRGVLSQDKYLRRYQLTSVVLFAALTSFMFYQWHSLDDQIKTINGSLSAMADYQHLAQGKDNLVYPLIREMANMDAGSLARWTIPASWRGIDGHISKYLARHQFRPIIFPALEDEILRRGEQLLQKVPVVRVRDQVTDIAPFLTWLNELLEYYRFVGEFGTLSSNQLDDQKKVLQQFSQLASYLYGQEVPPQFNRNSDLYGNALKRVCYPAGDCTANKSRKLTQFLASMESRATEQIALLSAELQNSILSQEAYQGDLFEVLQRVRLDPAASQAKQLPELLLVFARWYDEVSRRWLSGSDNSPCLELTAGLSKFASDVALSTNGRELVGQAATLFDGGRCVATVTELLRDTNYPSINSLFAGNSQGALTFRPEISAFREAIADLRDTSFFTVADRQTPDYVGENYYWDNQQLAAAVNYFAEFEQFASIHLGGANELIRSSSTAILHNAMQHSIATARIGQDQALNNLSSRYPKLRIITNQQRLLEQQVSQFKLASSALTELPPLLAQIGYESSAGALSRRTKNYSLNLLRSIDDLAEQARLYQSSERLPVTNYSPNAALFVAAENPPSIAGALYGVEQAPLLKDYLFNQRETVKAITLNLALPVLDFIVANQHQYRSPLSYREQLLFTKWRTTAEQVDKAEQNNPNNNMASLEDYFVNTLAKTKLASCNESAPLTVDLYGLDVFSEAQQSIVDRVNLICRQGESEHLINSYRKVTRSFNRQLFDAFPFVESGVSGDDASYAAVQEFFDDYRSSHAPAMQRLAAAVKDSDPQVAGFLSALDEAAEFFSTSLAPSGRFNQSGIEAEVQFRALEDRSRENSQIIHWELQFGDESISSPGTNKSIRWYYGQPVRLVLRWSDTADTLPANLDNNMDRNIDNNVDNNSGGNTADARENDIAVFEYSGPWSLLHFISEHRVDVAGSSPSSGSPEIVLGFNVAQIDKYGQSRKTSSQVFMRMTLFGLDGENGQRKMLRLPREFPNFTPDLLSGE